MRSPFSFKPFLLCLMVLLLLSVLSLIPEPTVGSFQFREVDLLASLKEEPSSVGHDLLPESRMHETESSPVRDSVSVNISVIENPPNDSCADGLTCLEDYSIENDGIRKFVEALSELKNKTSAAPVRIAFYGDSFIEGDVFCGSVRDTLQSLFGGRGVGFVPITSTTVGFRNTVKQTHDNWKTWSIVKKKDSLSDIRIGPAGYCFKPQADNWVEFRVSKQRYLREFKSMRLFYRNMGRATSLLYTINDTLSRTISLRKSSRLREWKGENINGKKILLSFKNADSLEVYGVSFEGGAGVYVDNFAMRGNSGVSLDLIPVEMFSIFNQYRDYKLILLQYGLNVVNPDPRRYEWYADRMVTVIEKLKGVFPDASIVLLSVSDRSQNVEGKFRTMESIPLLRDTQRMIAKRTHIVFWDLYEAMGGKDSMVKFVGSSPALAAKDYTHLTFKGGKKLAAELLGSVLYELDRYEKAEALQ